MKGFWEWENETIRVIELPSSFHEDTISALVEELYLAFSPVKGTPAKIKSCEARSECFIGFLFLSMFLFYVSVTYYH